MERLETWMAEHAALISGLAIFSVVSFVFSLVAVPFLVVQMRADFLVRERRELQTIGPWTLLRLVAKNLCGVVIFLAGVAMLVLPGQGLLSMVLGISLLNFPGKRRFERWLFRLGPVHRTVDWLRRRAGKEPLIYPSDSE